MSDRICPCGMSFPYPSQLKRHQNGKLGCIPYLLYVQSQNAPALEELANERGGTSNNLKEFLCQFCDKEFSTKFNQERHEKTCKNNNSSIVSNNNLSNIIESVLKITKYDGLMLDIDKNGNTKVYFGKSNDINKPTLTQQTINQTPEIKRSISTTSIIPREAINIPEVEIIELDYNVIPGNANNTTSGTTKATTPATISTNTNTNTGNIATSNASITNITTNITNNYNDTTPGVYPFGSENINFLTDEETLEILKSSNGANLVLQKIYSHIDNNNFMKMNKKEKTLEFFNTPSTLICCDTKEFIAKMYEQSKNLLQRMFFKCYKKLSEENKLVVWNNIQHISNILDTKSKALETGFANIITTNCNNSFKKAHFKGVKTNIDHNNKNVMNKMRALYNEIQEEKNKMVNDLSTKNITIDELLNKFWEPEKNNPAMDLDNHRNDLYCNHLETTPRFLLMKSLEKMEYQYLVSKNLTMGDIALYYDYKQSRITKEIKLLKDKFNEMPDSYLQDINNLFINKPNDDNEKALLDVRLNTNANILIQA